jgi:protein gp37
MADGSTIEWLKRPGTKPATWNPVRGCTRVSEGCVNCYAETMAARFSDPGMWGHGFAETIKKPDDTSVRRWTGKVELIEEMLDQPLRWKSPRTIFANSTSDLFHEALPDEAIDRIFAVMALCPQHTFLVLTKRPERMRAYLDGCAAHVRIERLLDDLKPSSLWNGNVVQAASYLSSARPLPNVWLGTSCEDQATADERIPLLLDTPAAIRFVSAEPLLGPINFLNYLRPPSSLPGRVVMLRPGEWIIDPDGAHTIWRGLDQIIVGGESGPNARPMHPRWACDIADQCQAASVPYFFKQWGAWVPLDADHFSTLLRAPRDSWMILDRDGELDIPDGRWPDEEAGEVAVIRVGKKAASRLLAGREWNEFPESRP